ncbi:MAG: hypothetical protein L3K26_13550 [Candidatus Hydrogenedentes bacterium]|nr:hypothetical protein [Candidatus Hydrogenedentota bacterium]
MLKWIALVALLTSPLPTIAEAVIDYAELAQRDAWLRHPVYGDASFDSFTHHPKNPVHRGAAPFEWPVNGSLFEDPVSGDWFLFIGHYRTGYKRDDEHPSRATVSRSKDRGEHWENLGPVFPDEEHIFAGEVSPMWNAPDVAVVYANGRYHMSFDWSTRNTTWANAANPPGDVNSGAGYAWAERPEGPYHRTATPIATTRDQPVLEGKYKRTYASTILQRKNDWLVLTLTDSGPNYGWGYLGMTSPSPEGPYTTPKLLLYPERDGFHPPLMEFHPAFIHEGFVYAPATSVALNRNFQMLWRAPLEKAMDPDAWKIFKHGSLWHAEPVEHESYGIWGQTISGFIDKSGVFQVMFASRDSEGMGTINIASRPWDTPYRDRGVYVSGHEGPSFVRLNQGGTVKEIAAILDINGTVTLAWNARGPVGPNRPASNATLHPLMLADYAGVKLTEKSWELITVAVDGRSQTIAQGTIDTPGRIECTMAWNENKAASLKLHGKNVWSGAMVANSGALGILADASSSAFIEQFRVTGDPAPARTVYLHTEAILGAAQKMADWKKVESEDFRYGIGIVSQAPDVRAKWNIMGTSATLWAPRGPDYGSADIYLDSVLQSRVDFHANTTEKSQALITITSLGNIGHAISVRNLKGAIPVDLLEVTH